MRKSSKLLLFLMCVRYPGTPRLTSSWWDVMVYGNFTRISRWWTISTCRCSGKFVLIRFVIIGLILVSALMWHALWEKAATTCRWSWSTSESESPFTPIDTYSDIKIEIEITTNWIEIRIILILLNTYPPCITFYLKSFVSTLGFKSLESRGSSLWAPSFHSSRRRSIGRPTLGSRV